MQTETIRRRIYQLAFIFYLFIVLYLTLLGRTPSAEGSFFRTPFAGYKDAINGIHIEFVYIIENILFFIPLGFLGMGVLAKKSSRSALMVFLFGTVLTVLIEFSQYVFRRGIFEVDDIVDNMMGTLIGIIAYQLAIFFCRWFNTILIAPKASDPAIK